MQSINKTPIYTLYREGLTAVDAVGTLTDRELGINTSSYEDICIQVIPKSGANPTVAVYFWSEHAATYVQQHTAISKTGVGATTPHEFTVEAKGRHVFVRVTAITAGSVDIAVSGFKRYE